MMSKTEQKDYTLGDHSQLFTVLAENLKSSFLTIARTAELASSGSDDVDGHLARVQAASSSALTMLDNYLLSLQLTQAGQRLALEPVSLAASLNDIAHQLNRTAEQRRCDLEVIVAGKYEPVMAHGAGLSAALLSLGHFFITAQSQQVHTKRPVITLAAHRTRAGIVAGLFAEVQGLHSATLRRSRKLYGRAHSPVAEMTVSGETGLFIADAILQNMSSGLRTARYQKLPGLAATFTSSQQMALV